MKNSETLINIPPETDDVDLAKLEGDENNSDNSSLETGDFSVDDAGQMEQNVISTVIEKFKNTFKSKLEKLSTRSKIRVREAVIILLLATMVAGLVPERASANEMENDKDQQEKKIDYTELDLNEMFGIDVNDMSNEEARLLMTQAMDSVKATSPEGEQLYADDFQDFNGEVSHDMRGELSNEGSNVIVRGGIFTHELSDMVDKSKSYDHRNNFREVIQVENIEAVGEPFKIKGTGDTEQEALIHAVLNAGEFIGSKVYQEDKYDVESNETEVVNDELSHFTKDTYSQAIKSYKVLSLKKVIRYDTSVFEAKVEVQPGEVQTN